MLETTAKKAFSKLKKSLSNKPHRINLSRLSSQTSWPQEWNINTYNQATGELGLPSTTFRGNGPPPFWAERVYNDCQTMRKRLIQEKRSCIISGHIIGRGVLILLIGKYWYTLDAL